MKQSKPMALGAILTALTVVLMLLGAVLEIGMYAAPLLAGLMLIPLGKQWGTRYQIACWIAASLLCFLLVPNIEQNLLYFSLFGWYPILRPRIQNFPPLLRLPLKLVLFNTVIVTVEALILLLLVPEVLTPAMTALLLILANVTFFAYDLLIPRMEALANRMIKR